MIRILLSNVGIINQRLIVDIALYFGLFLIVAMSLNFQYGNAGIPNMGCAVQVIMGGFAVSTFTLRLCLVLLKKAGQPILPYDSSYDWIYNNPYNIEIANAYLSTKPFTGISLFLGTLAVSILLGALMGWLVSFPGIRIPGQRKTIHHPPQRLWVVPQTGWR